MANRGDLLFKPRCGFIRKMKRAVRDLDHLGCKGKDLKISSDVLDSINRHHVLSTDLRSETILMRLQRGRYD